MMSVWKARASFAALAATLTVVIHLVWRRLSGASPNSGDGALLNAAAAADLGGYAKPASSTGRIAPTAAATSSSTVTAPPDGSPPYAAASGAERPSALQRVQSWLGIVGLLAAPATVITPLFYFYGYLYSRTYFAYFGIDSDTIGFTTTDYVLRSVTLFVGSFIPPLLLVSPTLLWAAVYIRHLAKAGRRPRLVSAVGWTAIALGVLGIVRGIVGLILPRLAPDHGVVLTPVTLAIGTVFVVVGYWMVTTSPARAAARPFAAAERGSLVIAGGVIVFALFWLTQSYATSRAEDAARYTATQLWSQETGVVLETSERITFPSNLIKESVLSPGDPSERIKFRYECFRALAVRGDRWVLVPARWTPAFGYDLVLTADSSRSVSTTRVMGLAQTRAADWSGDWQCPEVAPSP